MNQDNIATAIDAGKALGMPITVDENGREVIVIPGGYRVEGIESLVEKYLPVPRRLKASVTLHELDSFIEYCTEHKNPALRVFVDGGVDEPKFSACIDYHTPGKPSWREHWALFHTETTKEWERWTGQDGASMSQKIFAEFLEDQQRLIQAPPGAELLELVQTLEGKCDATYSSEQRLSNGKRAFTYREDVELKGQTGSQTGVVEFPTELVAAVAPFEGGAPYKVTCRMRYRLNQGTIQFWYSMVDPHLIIKDAVKEMVADIETGLGLKVWVGTP